MFRRLNRNRRHPKPDAIERPTLNCPAALKIHFDNEYGDTAAGVVRTFTLNKYFEFLRCGTLNDLSKSPHEPQDILCITSNISLFITSFLYLSVKQLRLIAIAHGLPDINRKPNLVAALMEHSCEEACIADCLVFRPVAVPRNGPFNKRVLPELVPDTAATHESMDDLDVLPLMINNDIIVDVEDSISYISTYKLNRSFDCLGLVTKHMVGDLHRADMEFKYKTVHVPNISGFVASYPHLSVRQLTELCNAHGIGAPSRKPQLLETLMSHECMNDCIGYHCVLLFEYRKKDREELVVPRTISSVRETENLRRSKFVSTK